MATKLFVGGLAYSVTSDDLRSLFEEVGEVESADVINDRDTGRSKGFGFVQMKSDDDVKKAIQELDGKEVSGRNIAVNEARPKERRERPGFGNHGGFNRDHNGSRGRSY